MINLFSFGVKAINYHSHPNYQVNLGLTTYENGVAKYPDLTSYLFLEHVYNELYMLAFIKGCGFLSFL